MSDRWQEDMQRRGLVDENGWFKHRLWVVQVPTVKTSHSDPLPDLTPQKEPVS